MSDSTRTGLTCHGTKRQTGFDFTSHMRLLVDDMVRRLSELSHIDLDRVAFSFSQTRKPVRHGLYASLMPMRFEDGETTTIRKGRKWKIQQYVNHQGIEILYVVSFYLPRFLDQDFHDKLTTVVHELWHISPQFNGDLRRFAGRCHTHSSSRKRYDTLVRGLADEWLSQSPPADLYEFLRYDFRELVDRFGHVSGTKIRVPKLYSID